MHGMSKMDRRGIFLTFMAFLLAGTVIALNASISQAELGLEEAKSEETAFRELNKRFANIMHQMNILGEGEAGKAFERLSPFDRLRSGENWVEVSQKMPAGEKIKRAYDSFVLTGLFTKEKTGNSLLMEIQNAPKGREWEEGSEEFPEISYIIFPQCLKFWVGGDVAEGEDPIMTFEAGSKEEDGCETGFSKESIEAYETEIRLNAPNFTGLQCQGVFAGCNDAGDRGKEAYAEVAVVLEGCSPSAFPEFGADCTKTISGNLDNVGPNFVEVYFGEGKSFKVKFLETDYTIELTKENLEKAEFKVKTLFKEKVDEVVLEPGVFDFSLKNMEFEFCRGITGEGCNCGDGECQSEWNEPETCPEDCG